MPDTVTTEITIAAPPAAVWSALTDLASYERWNPFITSAEGAVTVGERFSARFTPPGGRSTAMRPRFTVVEPEHRLAWLGSVGVRGIFDGAHEFVLTPTADGGTHLVQSESFGGVLVPVLRSMLRRTREGFAALDAALAVEAVRRTAAAS